MQSDIVQRLQNMQRDYAGMRVGAIVREAAAEITRLTEALRAAEEREKGLREALESKPWPPTDADLREMLALIVGAWWSESSANRLRTARMLNAEDIKGMYAVRDALAPYIARAALKGPSHD